MSTQNRVIDTYTKTLESYHRGKARKQAAASWLPVMQNGVIGAVAVGIVALAVGGAIYIAKLPKTEIKEVHTETVVEVPVVNTTHTVEQVPVPSNNIVLADGSTVYTNGTIVRPDGTTLTTAADISNAVTNVTNGDNVISGVTDYTIFKGDGYVSTGYRFDLTESMDVPVQQWCYKQLSHGIRYLANYIDGEVVHYSGLSAEEEALIPRCQWFETHDYGNHSPTFTPLPDSSVPVHLSNLVEKAMKSFEQHTGSSTANINVHYGNFTDMTLGTCTTPGTEMELSVNRLGDATVGAIQATVFHELAHCIYGVGHVDIEDHILSSHSSSIVEAQTHWRWAQDILSVVNNQ